MKKKLIMFVLALCIMVLFSIMENSNQAVVYAGEDDCGKLTICFIPSGDPDGRTLKVSVDAWNVHRENNGGDHGPYVMGSCQENGVTENNTGSLEVKEWKESVSNN